MIEYLMQTARSYIFTTATPPALAVATRAALRVLREEGWRRQRLAELIARFRTGAEQLGLSLMPSSTPIQPILVGSNQAAQKASIRLRNAGFLVGAIRPPTVPVGTARLRITLTAGHGDADVDGLLTALAEINGLSSTNSGELA
jgi:8-amino-7-oxononanoate synthase